MFSNYPHYTVFGVRDFDRFRSKQAVDSYKALMQPITNLPIPGLLPTEVTSRKPAARKQRSDGRLFREGVVWHTVPIF